VTAVLLFVFLVLVRWALVIIGFAVGHAVQLGIPLSAFLALCMLGVLDVAVHKGLE
jgi:hypothetical protein